MIITAKLSGKRFLNSTSNPDFGSEPPHVGCYGSYCQFSAECKPPVPARKAMFMRLQRIGNEAAANDNLAVLIKFQVGLEKHDTID